MSSGGSSIGEITDVASNILTFRVSRSSSLSMMYLILNTNFQYVNGILASLSIGVYRTFCWLSTFCSCNSNALGEGLPRQVNTQGFLINMNSVLWIYSDFWRRGKVYSTYFYLFLAHPNEGVGEIYVAKQTLPGINRLLPQSLPSFPRPTYFIARWVS